MTPFAARIRTILIDLSIAAAIGAVLALLGPFGSFAIPFPLRLAYWVLLTVGGYVIYRPVMATAEGLAERLDLPTGAMWAAGCLVASVPMSVLVWLADEVNGALRTPSFQLAALYYGNVVVIAGIVTLVYWITHQRPPLDPVPARPPAQPAAEASAAAVRFLERLPPGAGRDLVALEMQDHYVMAHMRAGSHMILMRMRDAIDELAGIDGAQVHRSWWVARDAVQGVIRDGRNLKLMLPRGLEAPVARSQVAALQEAGWLG